MIMLIVTIIVSCLVLESASKVVDGYYWRDFTGKIPEDALEGGTNDDGKPMYIGQVFNYAFLIPAQIDADSKIVYYEYGFEEHSTKKHVKILCTQHPENFEWIQTDQNKIRDSNKNFVIGGAQQTWKILIGRGRHGDHTSIGKLAIHENADISGMYFTRKGKFYFLRSFEALAYTPKINKV